MIRAPLLTLLLLVSGIVSAQDQPVTTVLTAPSGVRFGFWPRKPTQPAPTLFIFATTVEGTLDQEYYRQAGNRLAEKGWLCVSVDLPCHGPQRRDGEPDGLDGWRSRCDRDEDPMADLTQRLRAVLDHLTAEKLTDPNCIAACGTSRGGFSALHFAAAEPRVKCVAAFSPVTELTALREFRGAEQNPLVQRLAIIHQAEALAGRAVWLVIGDRDARVGTDHAVQFARAVTTASLKLNRPSLVDLHVLAEPKGHTVPAGSADRAAEWIERQFAQP